MFVLQMSTQFLRKYLHAVKIVQAATRDFLKRTKEYMKTLEKIWDTYELQYINVSTYFCFVTTSWHWPPSLTLLFIIAMNLFYYHAFFLVPFYLFHSDVPFYCTILYVRAEHSEGVKSSGPKVPQCSEHTYGTRTRTTWFVQSQCEYVFQRQQRQQ